MWNMGTFNDPWKWFFYMCCLLPFLVQPAIRDPPGTTFLEPCSIPMTFLQLGHLVRKAVISCDISDILTTDYMLSSGQKHAKHHLVSVLRLSSPDFSTILQQSCQEEIQKFDVVRWFSCSAGLTEKPFRIWFQDVSTTPSKLPSFVQLCTWVCLKMVVKWLLNGY